MKCRILETAVLAVVIMAGMASGDWSDNFDSYEEGPLGDQGGWQAWGGGSESGAVVTADQARSQPHSLAIDADDDAVHEFSGCEAGPWTFTAWQFFPKDAPDVSQFFILLNQYEDGGGDTNWSTQLEFNPDDAVVESEFEGATLPLVTGEWAEIKVVIDLDADRQMIFYDGQLLVEKSWTDGVSGGGELNIAAVDLWGNDAAYAVYYDDMSLMTALKIGACCLLDGDCMDSVSPDQCTAEGGLYQGHATTCDMVFCPVMGECGWIFQAPFQWSGDTALEDDSCALRPSPDAQFQIDIPYPGEWTFSVCDAQWDTYLYLGSACCTGDIAENDDAPDCGVASKIIIDLEPGTYYLTLEGHAADDAGPFPLEVTGPCFVECPPDSIFEGEWDQCEEGYVDLFNSGCGAPGPPYPFSPIACGDTICGWTGLIIDRRGRTDRDSDWYEFPVPSKQKFTLTMMAEVPMLFFQFDPASGTCQESEFDILAIREILPCEKEVVKLVLDPGESGKGWSVLMKADWEYGCPELYTFTLDCESLCPADITGPDGEPDGVVDVLDLLELLAQWGASGTADITGPDGDPDGVVDVLDLLQLLAAWGPCS